MTPHILGTAQDLHNAYPRPKDFWTKREPAEVKRQLHAKGWSHRRAAAAVGCTGPHVFQVLNGGRISAALLQRLASLPTCPPGSVPAKSIYAARNT